MHHPPYFPERRLSYGVLDRGMSCLLTPPGPELEIPAPNWFQLEYSSGTCNMFHTMVYLLVVSTVGYF